MTGSSRESEAETVAVAAMRLGKHSTLCIIINGLPLRVMYASLWRLIDPSAHKQSAVACDF